jgi:hypothetical protein
LQHSHVIVGTDESAPYGVVSGISELMRPVLAGELVRISDLFDAIPARWQVARPAFDPGRGAWIVTCWGPNPRRGETPQSVSGTGKDEAAA